MPGLLFLLVFLHKLIPVYHRMTIREKVEAESPDGNVLFIKDLRKCLGLESSYHKALPPTPALVGPQRPAVEVLLVGHDLRGDFPKMRADDIRFDPHLCYFGCIDTYVIIEDTRREQVAKSLSRLMEHYGFAGGRIVRPQALPASKAKFVFFGGHNAGNDAIATLKVAIAQALDSKIKANFEGNSKSEDYLTDEYLSSSLTGINKSMILLAYDSEGVESNRYDSCRQPIGPATTEHGFAWLTLADVADVPPGKYGINWHPYIRARHWLNWEYRHFANYKYVVGNPLGFWKEFGETQYYHASEGPAPFHQLFQELASATVAVVEKRDSVSNFSWNSAPGSANVSSDRGYTRTSRRSSSQNAATVSSSRGYNPTSRQTSAQSPAKVSSNGGYNPK